MPRGRSSGIQNFLDCSFHCWLSRLLGARVIPGQLCVSSTFLYLCMIVKPYDNPNRETRRKVCISHSCSVAKEEAEEAKE
ncbi:hypothetical protein JD844_015162 [Phrynosoma platyrhinos]|uniref:Uncharacterized protein n=1 Tax=Phrynosoma platyrhinos TaxID=52577 RepID=A0ABQ7T8K6_PHRPL|nr:hypothetical protein JD844_015162 [Phrynosoma platyrhinos]